LAAIVIIISDNLAVFVIDFFLVTIGFSDMLREMILTFQNECIQIIAPVLVQAHNSFQESHVLGMNCCVSLSRTYSCH